MKLTVVEAMQQGVSAQKKGKLQDAERFYRIILQAQPLHPGANYNLGLLAQSLNKTQLALPLFKIAVTTNPNEERFWISYNNALIILNHLKEAELSARKMIELKPDFIEAHSNLNIILQTQGKLDEAEAGYKKIIAIKPNYAKAHGNLGVTLQSLGRLGEAEVSFRNAIEFKSDFVEAYNNLGNVLKQQGRLKEAEASFRNAITLKVDYAEAHNNLGSTFREQGKLEEAEKSCRKSIEIKPNYAEAHNNLSNTLKEQGRLGEAEKGYKKTIELKPNYAEAYFNLSLTLLQLENFMKGWEFYEWRWKSILKNSKVLRTLKSKWFPGNVQRVLLLGEQGIGDVIMFSSLIESLYEVTSRVIVQVDKRLLPIFKRSFSRDIIFISTEDHISESDYDAYISMGSLPQYFRQNTASFKNTSVGWLSADKKRAKDLRTLLLNKEVERVIGISWHSTSKNNGANEKTIPLNKLAQCLSSPNVKLVNLQYGNVEDEIKKLSEDFGIDVAKISDLDNTNNLDDLAALIEACDEVVSIDNATINLAGALGKKSHVLLPYSCDWRWGHKKENSYWYDSVKVYRQDKINSWDSVLKQLKI